MNEPLLAKRDPATSDGISRADWDNVTDLACTLVNLVNPNPSSASAAVQRSMLRLLKRLGKKYGARPSLYATKADYIGRPRLREKYLLKAYAITCSDDLHNKSLIAASLANFYISEQPNPALGRHWLTQLKADVANYPDDDAQEEIQRLEYALTSLITP